MRRKPVDWDRVCWYCGGIGYVKRIVDHAMVKCWVCDGDGKPCDRTSDGMWVVPRAGMPENWRNHADSATIGGNENADEGSGQLPPPADGHPGISRSR